MTADLTDDEYQTLANALRALCPADIGKLRDGGRNKYEKFRHDPAGYIQRVLRAKLTPQQIEICNALMRPPYRVIVVSANNVGKSHIAGALINWYYDCYNPGVCISTAPSDRDVKDVMWKEVRVQRRTRNDFKGPTVAEMGDAANHYAKGYTGTTAEAFHGRHDKHLFFLVDEATAIGGFVFEGIKSMFKANGNHFWLILLNPINPASAVYAEANSIDRDGNPAYNVIRLNALEHPNIVAGLKGEEPPIPGAVDLHQVDQWFTDWFEEVGPEDGEKPYDVIWPPPEFMHIPGILTRVSCQGRVRRLRPGMEGMARVLGLWPNSSEGQVWSDAAWQSATRKLKGQTPMPVTFENLPEIGGDIASDGGDCNEFVVQCEGVALEHKVGKGWNVGRVKQAIRELCEKWVGIYNQKRPVNAPFCEKTDIPVRVDDANVGHAVVDDLRDEGYNIIGISNGTISPLSSKYPLMRDQLWFEVRDYAENGLIDLSRLPEKSLVDLRRQAMAVRWLPIPGGRRMIVPKKETRKILGRSPDGMDALNLAYLTDITGDAPATFKQSGR